MHQYFQDAFNHFKLLQTPSQQSKGAKGNIFSYSIVSNNIARDFMTEENGINKLWLSWAKLSCKLGFGCTVINICCLMLINMK